jgi:imidazolonepropionase-like amidohydrolase
MAPAGGLEAHCTVDACLKATRKLMMSGADHVKICTSGGVLSPTDKLTGSQFTVPEIKAVCDTVRMMVSQYERESGLTSVGRYFGDIALQHR